VTGVPAREWINDPAAMGTAVNVLELIAEKQRKG
jgi:hypothetical protein